MKIDVGKICVRDIKYKVKSNQVNNKTVIISS